MLSRMNWWNVPGSGFGYCGSRLAAAAACVLLCLGTTAPARGATLSANTSNDALSGNEFHDDLYTAGVGLSLKLPGHRLSLEERMFTDRTSGTRFDETRFGWDVEIREIHRWQPSVQVGAVRVGRGILGQPFQNAAHRLVDSDPVDLEYPDEDRLFPSLDLAVRRDLAMTQTLRLTPLVEASGAAGFRYHVGAAVRATYRPLWAIEL